MNKSMIELVILQNLNTFILPLVHFLTGIHKSLEKFRYDYAILVSFQFWFCFHSSLNDALI